MPPKRTGGARPTQTDSEAVSATGRRTGAKRDRDASTQDAPAIGDARASKRPKNSRRDSAADSEGSTAKDKQSDVKIASSAAPSKRKAASLSAAPPDSLDRSREAKYLQRGDGVRFIVGVDEAGRGEAARSV
jgi:hypothetical protein